MLNLSILNAGDDSALKVGLRHYHEISPSTRLLRP